MGYQVSNEAPKVTFNGRTFCVDAVKNILDMLQVSIFEEINGEWVCIFTAYSGGSSMVPDVVAKGGIVLWMDDILNKLSVALASIFAAQTTPPFVFSSEPNTNDDVVAAIKAMLYHKMFSTSGGILSLVAKV